ncbi:unnamed protein product [Toxocara canis]|uniref:Transmembrane protein n=1 Tax=Toxocara canis TaxID=6265 RepID=A0A183UZK2_TOXCA|nr:unnamed protein product [Toxocara canis]
MRLLVRFALVACAVIIFLIWYGISRAANNDSNDPETVTGWFDYVLARNFTDRSYNTDIKQSFIEIVSGLTADETVRILLMSEQENQQMQQISVPQITLNVAVVLIVSLLSVALLITGIIVVAVTLDPTTADNESDEEEELSDARTTPVHNNKFLWHAGISSPTGRLLPQFDTLARLHSLSDVTVA